MFIRLFNSWCTHQSHITKFFVQLVVIISPPHLHLIHLILRGHINILILCSTRKATKPSALFLGLILLFSFLLILQHLLLPICLNFIEPLQVMKLLFIDSIVMWHLLLLARVLLSIFREHHWRSVSLHKGCVRKVLMICLS